MPTNFRIDLDQGVVIARGDEDLGPQDFATVVEAYSSHPDYRPEMNILWDLRGARVLIEIGEMKALAGHVSTLRAREAPHRLAYVVEHEPTQSLTRLFPKVGPEHPVDYRTFEDLAGALEWLGLPPDYKP